MGREGQDGRRGARAPAKGGGQPLLRDYGLTLGLLFVSVLLLRTSLEPRTAANRELEAEWLRRQENVRELQRRVEELGATDRAEPDALMIESMSRQAFGTLGLPENEIPVDALPGWPEPERFWDSPAAGGGIAAE